MNDACTVPALRRACADLEFTLPETVLEGLAVYLVLLEKWNRKMNLVGPSSWRNILDTLVVDSFFLADFLQTLPLGRPSGAEPEKAPEGDRAGEGRAVHGEAAQACGLETASGQVANARAVDLECWDLGSGAGLPGIPLRLLWRAGRYTMVEAREKRALFLQTALASLSLPCVSVFRGRAEHFMPTRSPADLVVSRAFMPVPRMLELIAPYLAPWGVCVFLTLRPWAEALQMEFPEEEAVFRNWTNIAEKRYSAGTVTRCFWALRRA